MDEKGFLIGVLQKTRRVFDIEQIKKGKLLGAGQDGNREWVTIIGAICMDGTPLPPAIIYQADSGNLQDTWLDKFDPKEQCCFFSSLLTGWTNEELGLSWLTGVFDKATKEKSRFGRDYRLLFVDGHNSHVNMKFLSWAEQHRILIAVYPPHSTHRLQPLDVSLYNPLSNYYSQELNNWIFKTQGLSSISKRDFFSLFWPAFQRSFNIKNILSGWEKTGLQPFNPAIVLDQISNERPLSSTSGSSVLLNPDWRKVRHIVKDVMGEVIGPEARKLINTMDYLTTQNTILSAKVKDLQETVRLEKGKARRGKPLFDDLGVNGEVKAMFFSPSKIQRARERQREREIEKDSAQAQKEEEKLRKQQEKEEKQAIIVQRKVAREEKRLQREVDRRQKQALQKEATQQRQINKQLRNEVKEAQKKQRNQRKQSVLQQLVDFAVNEVFEAERAQTRTSRSGRQIRPNQRFND
jgi:flagellar biosynthesis GTPase FlhF